MSKILTFEIPENELNQLKALLDEFHREAEKSREIMRQDQVEIERLREESKAIRARTEKTAAQTGKVLDEMCERILKAA